MKNIPELCSICFDRGSDICRICESYSECLFNQNEILQTLANKYIYRKIEKSKLPNEGNNGK